MKTLAYSWPIQSLMILQGGSEDGPRGWVLSSVSFVALDEERSRKSPKETWKAFFFFLSEKKKNEMELKLPLSKHKIIKAQSQEVRENNFR